VVALLRLAWLARVLLPRAAPREVPWLVVKRNDMRLGRTYGHWWLELDGEESYGWWPHRTPVRLRDFLVGPGQGDLNGVSSGGGTLRRDSYHGERADHVFHPVLVRRRSDWRLRRDIRRFAGAFAGGWRWRPRAAAANCRSFQATLLASVGLVDGPGGEGSLGAGCPVLRPLRRVRLVPPYRPRLVLPPVSTLRPPVALPGRLRRAAGI
jgi:hypothetical protein